MQHKIALSLAVVAVAFGAVSAARCEIRVGIATPLTGSHAWAGEETRAGAEDAIKSLNRQGGVLGQSLVPIFADDFCDPEQGVAAAKKLVADGVRFVVGHQCSGVAIPASLIYEDAKIVFISPKATNPRLTDRGLRHTFRTCGRDDRQGALIAERIRSEWPQAGIAIIHDDRAYGQGVAREVVLQLQQHRIEPALIEQVSAGQVDFSEIVSSFQAKAVDLVFYGGYPAEAGLLIREIRSRGLNLTFIVPDGVAHEDFSLIAGEAVEGTLMTQLMNTETSTGAAIYAFAAVEVWAKAVEASDSLDADEVSRTLRERTFSTVLGDIGFDQNGDVTGFEPFTWYVWNGSGRFEREK